MARQGAVGVEELIRKKICSLRQWKLTRLGKQKQNRRFEFTLMTYNILSQTAIENHRYLYRHCDSRFLEEDYRISQILPEILETQSDVICFQEIEERLFEEKVREIFHSNGFEALFKKRTGCKDDGCAILWRRKKFGLVAHQDVEFSAKDCRHLDRDNVGLIAVLTPKHPETKKVKLHVATTHLLFNPKRGDIKLSQLRVLLAQLEKMALKQVSDSGQRTYHPVILCGDFNVTPFSPLYEFIDTGRLEVDNRLSGDMSGQAEGKNKGSNMSTSQLSLKKIGINEAGRYDSKFSKMALKKESVSSKSQNSVEDVKSPDSPHSSNCKGSVPLDPKWLASIQNPAWVSAFRALNQNPTGSNVNGDDCSDDPSPCFYHDFHFVPAYKYQRHVKELPITSMTGKDFNNVDHIFYNVKEKHNSTFTEGRLKLLGVYTLLHKQDLLDIGGLPNAYLGSDHICLMAKFSINGYWHRPK